MNYLKVFVSFAQSIEPLNDAEVGRLFRAMLEYAATGTEPDFKGNERFIWPTARMNIDNQGETYAEKCKNMNKARSRRWESKQITDKTNQIIDAKDQITDKTNLKNQKADEEKEKEKDKDNIKPPISPLEGESEAFVTAVNEFKKHRAKLKRPMTDYALTRFISRVKRMRKDEAGQIELINLAIDKGWQDVYEPSNVSVFKQKNDAAKGYIQRGYSDQELNALITDLSGDDI